MLRGRDGSLSGISAYRILTLNDIVVVLLLLAYISQAPPQHRLIGDLVKDGRWSESRRRLLDLSGILIWLLSH